MFWYDLGRTDIGLLGMHFVPPAPSRVPFHEMVKRAFQFVLEFSADSRQWVPEDCKAGPEGYTRWISLFETGREDEYGASYDAVELAEGRKFAVEFLEEAKARCEPALRPLFDTALQEYRLAAENLSKLSHVLPLNIPSAQRSANLKEIKRRQAAMQHLRAARDAEAMGLKALAGIVEKL